MKIFVSYTLIDKEINKELLVNFSRRLKNLGEVFVDLIDNNSSDKQARVLSELDSSDYLILIETKNTYLSKWVNIEINRAVNKHIPIIKFPHEKIFQLTDRELLNKISN